jgi:hypothetical protein
LFITIVLERKETLTPHRMVVALQEEGQPAAPVLLDTGMTMFSFPGSMPAEEAVLATRLVADLVGLQFDRPGRYAFVLLVDDDEWYRIWVQVGVPPAQLPAGQAQPDEQSGAATRAKKPPTEKGAKGRRR